MVLLSGNCFRSEPLDELTKAFAILKRSFPGYESRPQQLEMASEVYACLKENKRLLVEAGTGVGKSFAYLIPSILLETKTVISTASIALQDQLVNKDLFFLQSALRHEFSYGLLKGKNNYLCLKRVREYAESGESFEEFREWVGATDTGDKNDLPSIPAFWPKVCGDSEDCNTVQCPFYGDCFYYGYFKEIKKKDLIVVNHYLLIYDLLSGFNLLPSHNRLVIDEAHQIEDVISHVAGTTLSRSRMLWLLYRLRGLKIEVDHLIAPVENFFKGADIFSRTTAPIPNIVTDGLGHLKKLLALDNVVRKLDNFMESADDDELRDRIDTTINQICSLTAVINDFMEQPDGNKVYYLLKHKNEMEMKSNIVECQNSFAALIGGYESTVMTSATLATGDDFRFLKSRLGITAPRSETGFEEKIIGSPFNYEKQALLYLENELPPPDGIDNDVFYRGGIKKIEKLIDASEGRALVLFTSYHHLRFTAENLETEYPFKTQGDMPPARLIQWFKDTPNSVLLATATFWQGIDIKGDKLSLVIIAKIPFGSPGDPVYDERCRRLAERWFKDLALPSAVLLLRQGFGRLIRGSDDRGVVAVLDTRLVASSYAGDIVSSLPSTKVVHKIDAVKNFFDTVSQAAASGHSPVAAPTGAHGEQCGI
jgi:ATP-dependent DNA helicase DinG